MIIESSAQHSKAQMTRFLVASKLEGVQGDDIGLDIIEFIALKLRPREDHQVAELGYFVRSTLLYFHLGQLDYPDVHARLVTAALAAPLGYEAMARTFQFGCRAVQR